MSNTNQPSSFQAPQSPRKGWVAITATEDDAKKLLTDAVWVSAPDLLNAHLAYLEAYNEVVVAIPDRESARTTARHLRSMHKHLTIAVPTERAWKGEGSIQSFMDAQHLLPSQAIPTLAAEVEYIPDGGCFKPDDANCIDFGVTPGILTGIPELDRETGGLRYGELSVLVGCSGHGKSTLAEQIILSAVSQDIKTCVFSGEHNQAMTNTRLFGQAAGKAHVEIVEQADTGKEFAVVRDEFLKARIKATLAEYTDFIDCNEGILPFSDILRCFRTHARQGYRFFVVDNMMVLTIGAGDKEYAQQADFIYALLRFAAEFNVHVLVAAHPKKSDAEIRSLNDIFGSSKVANWAHDVWAIHKLSAADQKAYSAETGKVFCPDAKVKVLKSRVAPTDTAVFLDFDSVGRRFYSNGAYPQFYWECPLQRIAGVSSGTITDHAHLDPLLAAEEAVRGTASFPAAGQLDLLAEADTSIPAF